MYVLLALDLSLWSRPHLCAPAIDLKYLLEYLLDISNLHPKCHSWFPLLQLVILCLSKWQLSTPFSWFSCLGVIFYSSVFLVLHISDHWTVLLVLTLKHILDSSCAATTPVDSNFFLPDCNWSLYLPFQLLFHVVARHNQKLKKIEWL